MFNYAAEYFNKTVKIAKEFKNNDLVTLQFFQRQNNVMLCGINEVIELLKKHTPYQQYKIKYLPEKTIINQEEVVLELTGPYYLFGAFEGIIDGILARQTSLATNAYHLTQASNKKIICMSDRADHYLNQERDGYAIACGGILTQVTSAQTKNHNGTATGTMPHALIQLFNGDLVAALKAYEKMYPNEKITALVDFNNDVINDTLKALKTFGSQLAAIRVDTSPALVDKMFDPKDVTKAGVSPEMIFKLRKTLDQNQGKHVKIIVSSGFDLAKIKQFESKKVPVDIYGVGASLLKINNYFTADAVKLNGKNIAKYGRKYKEMRHECQTISPASENKK